MKLCIQHENTERNEDLYEHPRGKSIDQNPITLNKTVKTKKKIPVQTPTRDPPYTRRFLTKKSMQILSLITQVQNARGQPVGVSDRFDQKMAARQHEAIEKAAKGKVYWATMRA